MNSQNDLKRIISYIEESTNDFYTINHKEEIDIDPYVDLFTTKQQRTRDKKITELLELYVEAYSYKNKSNKRYKRALFIVCIGILLLFSIALIILVIRFNSSTDAGSIESVIQLMTVCVTFLTLIIGILKIITKYVFPVNDEEYITRIVEIIQNNDLENKKENIRVRLSKDTDDNKVSKESVLYETVDKL